MPRRGNVSSKPALRLRQPGIVLTKRTDFFSLGESRFVGLGCCTFVTWIQICPSASTLLTAPINSATGAQRSSSADLHMSFTKTLRGFPLEHPRPGTFSSCTSNSRSSTTTSILKIDEVAERILTLDGQAVACLCRISWLGHSDVPVVKDVTDGVEGEEATVKHCVAGFRCFWYGKVPCSSLSDKGLTTKALQRLDERLPFGSRRRPRLDATGPTSADLSRSSALAAP